MIIAHQYEGTYTLNVEPGEDIMKELKDFVREQGIRAAQVSGLGAAAEVEVAYYDLKLKEYQRTTVTEDLEIISLIGNIARSAEDEPIVHIHGSFGRRDYSLFGGHLFACVVSGAGEIHLRTFPGVVSRAYDDATGLTLMCAI